MRVIREKARELSAPLHVAGEDFAFSITNRGAEGLTFDYSSGSLALNALRVPLVGDYQALNASLAVRAFELVAGDAGEGAVREGLLGMRPPGRLELIRHEPPVYLDGAHNPAAAEALARALEGLGMRPVMVIGVMGDKDVEGILAPLLPLAEGAIFASPGFGRSAPAERLLSSARALGHDGETAPTVRKALGAALSRGKPVLVTGSFFTIGEAKEALLGAAPSRVARLGEWQAAP